MTFFILYFIFLSFFLLSGSFVLHAIYFLSVWKIVNIWRRKHKKVHAEWERESARVRKRDSFMIMSYKALHVFVCCMYRLLMYLFKVYGMRKIREKIFSRNKSKEEQEKLPFCTFSRTWLWKILHSHIHNITCVCFLETREMFKGGEYKATERPIHSSSFLLLNGKRLKVTNATTTNDDFKYDDDDDEGRKRTSSMA